MRHPGLVLGAVLLAACVDGGFTPPERLTPPEVAGTYRVCELRFTPTHRALPTAAA